MTEIVPKISPVSQEWPPRLANPNGPKSTTIGALRWAEARVLNQERKGHISLRKCPGHWPGVPGTPGGTNGGLPAGVPGISC